MTFGLHLRRSFKRLRMVDTAISAFLLVAILASAGVSGTLSAATPTAAQYTAPMQTFLVNYLKDANSAHYNPSPNFVIPAVWLYSPKGDLMTLASDNASLQTLITTFPPAQSTAPQNQANLNTLLRVVESSSGKKSVSVPSSGKWTAVLFLNNSPSCQHCEHFEQGMRKFTQAHSASLDTVTVMITTP